MPSDSKSESKPLAESAEIGETGDRCGRLQDAGCLERRDGEIEVDGSDVKVSAENVEYPSSEAADISGRSEILEEDAISSENLRDVEKLESKGGSVEEIGDGTLGLGEIGVGSEIVEKDETFVERHRSESLQDEHKLDEEVVVMEVRSEAKIGEDSVADSDNVQETVDGQREFVQVDVVDIHSGSDVVKNGVSCSEKSEGTMNDEIACNSLESQDHEQVEVAVIGSAVGQEDEVSQTPEPQVKVHHYDHEDSISQNENILEEESVALESVAVDDSVKLEKVDTEKEPRPADPLEEEQMNELGDGSMMRCDQETSVSHASLVGTEQKICENKLGGETAHNSLDGQTSTADISDQGQEKVGAESSAGQGDIGEHKPLEINQAPELEIVDSEDEMGDGPVMKHGCDHNGSTSKKILAGGDQGSDEAGNAIMDFIAVDESTKLSEARAEKDLSADDPVEEARLQLAESVDEDAYILSNDQEESMVSHASSVDIDHNISHKDKGAETQVPEVDDHQKIQEEDSCSLDSAPFDVINCHQVRGSAELDMDTVIDGNRGKQPEAYVQEESDSIFDPVPVDSMVHQQCSVEKGPNPDIYVAEEHANLIGKTPAENAIESLLCDDHQGNDPEASAPETPFEKTNQSFQEKRESVSGPVPVDSVANQADSVVENPNFTEPAAEAEVGDESVMDGSEGKDHKASSSEMFLLGTNQKHQETQDTTLVLVPVDNTKNEQASHVEAPNLADPAVVSQPQIVLNEAVVGHVEASNFADPVVVSQPQLVLIEAVAGHFDAPNLADPFVELQQQVVLKEAVEGDESLLHADNAMDFDNSVSQSPVVDHQETGDESFASKASLGVDAQNIHENYVLEAPNLANHGIEIPPLSDQVTEAPNLADHMIEAPPLSDQVTEASYLPDHDTQTPALVDQVAEAPYLADVVLEPQPQLALDEAIGGDTSPLDVDKETDNKTSVSHTSFLEIQEANNEYSAAKSSLVDNDQNITKENDAIFGSVLAGCATDHQSYNVGEFSIVADTVVDKQPRLGDGETEMGDNSMKNADQGKDLEASDLPMLLVDTNENIQQENLALDLVILNGALNHEADTVTQGSILILSVEEQSHVIGAETKVGDGSTVDLDQHGNHEGSPSNMSLVDHTIGHLEDRTAEDINPANVVAESIEKADEKQKILDSVDVGDVTVDGSTDGELKTRGGKEKSLKKTKEKVIQSLAAICDQYVSYHLPVEKANFSISDLVWGKVKSHPWWPGQIFDPSDASKLAMKYQKKDSFLVAYYGDKTFAWCDESQLKPFHSYFSQMEKLCSSDTFVKAIHDILVEVSRRVDLGMACSCLPEEAYTDIKHQKVENAGIRGGIISSIIDRPTVVNYFQPDKLLQYIETLARFPNGKVDRLEFLIAQSQLKAFYRSKGYRELPVFTFTRGVMESVAENPPPSGKELEEDKHCTPTTPKRDSSISKREHGSKDDGKRKNISKRSEDGVAVHTVNGVESKSVTKAAERSILSSSCKKRIAVESDPVDSGSCKKRMLDSFDDLHLKLPSPTTASSFKIGEFIRRAASQLTGVPPIIKCQGETHKKHDVTGFDDLTGNPAENQKINLSFTDDYNSTDEMLSQLCSAAKDPMNEYNFVPPIVAFFTEFRDFCVSSFPEDKECVEKRKRGRAKKVISQQGFSDISLSEDEKHAEKHKRGMQMKNINSQLAFSDVSSGDEKPVEKRKRGRPRKNPKPASSDSSEDKKPIQKLQRNIPHKVNYQPAPNEKRKRGRPRKVHADSVLSNTSKPDHTKDSYSSDMDLQKERNNKNQILKQYKRRKSSGELSLSHHSTPMSHIEQQLQLVTMNPNMKHKFVAERSIISVDEKIVDECMPTALILSFNNANSIPSETDLIRIFSRYGPLKEAETDVFRKSNRAKVVFKRRVDAETAFSSAGKYSIFGPGLLSYQLKPWTPKSILQATPQGSQDVALVVTPQKNHDAEPIATAQEQEETGLASDPMELEPEGIKSSPRGKHDAEHQDEEHSISPLDKHDLTPNITHDNLDAASIITLQDRCNKETHKGINVNVSEAMISLDTVEVEIEGKESSPQDKHDPSLIATMQQNHDETLVASPQKNHDSAPQVILREKCNEGCTVGCNLEISEQAEDAVELRAEGKGSSPQDKHGQDNQDVELVTSSLDQHNLTPAIGQDNLDAASISTLQEKWDNGALAGSNLEISEQVSCLIEVEAEDKESLPQDEADQEKEDDEPVAPPPDEHDITPTSGKDYLDPPSIIPLLNKCNEGPIVGTSLELSEQNDALEVEAEGNKLSPHNRRSLENEDKERVASPLDEHDLMPTMIQDNIEASPIIMQRDTRDAALAKGSDLEVSEQEKSGMTQETMQTKAGGNNLEVSEQGEPGTVQDTMQVEGKESS